MVLFCISWEQRNYSDLGVHLQGGNLSYESLAESGKYKCVLYGDLYTKYDAIIFGITNSTNCQALEIKRNDILFPQSTTVDALSLISPACLNEESAMTSGVFVIRPNKDIDGNFVSYYTKGNNKQKYKLSTKAQGLTIVHLYYQSISDESIYISTYNEQIKISSLLMNLDSLITLHQRNVFGHETYLSNKSTVSWEQRKLSEICSIKKGKQLNRDNLFIQGRYYVLNGGMTPSGYTDNYNTEENSISISEGGNSCGFVYLNKSKFWSGGHNYTLFNNFLNTDFLYQYLKSKEAFLMSLRVGSGLPNLQKTRLIETLIATTNNEEQIRITSLLTSLDSLITLHQRKQF